MKHAQIFRIAVPLLLLAAAPASPVAAPPRPPAERAPALVPPEIPVALLVDLATGQTLFSRDPTRRFVPASVTKVMTSFTAFKLIGQGRLRPEMPVVVSETVADQWSGEGSSMFLQAGDRVTVGELLLGVTTVSANDAAVMLAAVTTGSQQRWLALMNANAAELGMKDTHFGTPNGWPDEGRTYTSARDLALLAEALTTRYPGLYRRYFGHRGMSFHDIAQTNHDPVTGVVPGADGIKTGYTRQAGYTFVGSAERDGRRLVVVIGGAPSATLRNRAARDLLRWGFEAFTPRQIVPAEARIGTARVQDGAARSVGLTTAQPVLASVPAGRQRDLRFSVRYRGPIEAPVAVGQPVATLRVEVPGQRPHDVPLLAAEAVPRAGALRRLWNGLVGIVT